MAVMSSDDALAWAKQVCIVEHRPYVWSTGGSRDASSFDCSHFVWNAFTVPLSYSTTGDMESDYKSSGGITKYGQFFKGMEYNASIIRPGYILLYRKADGSGGHTALYAGDGATYEARGSDYGCGSWSVNDNNGNPRFQTMFCPPDGGAGLRIEKISNA